MTNKADELQKKLAALKQTYVSQLGERIGSLDTAFQAIRDGNDFDTIKEGLVDLSFNAHKLAGTAGTFGFLELGEAGADIEIKSDEFVKIGVVLSDGEKDELAEMLVTCRSLAKMAEDSS